VASFSGLGREVSALDIVVSLHMEKLYAVEVTFLGSWEFGLVCWLGGVGFTGECGIGILGVGFGRKGGWVAKGDWS